MKDPKVIVAINNDKDAPFSKSDYVWKRTYLALPELEKAL